MKTSWISSIIAVQELIADEICQKDLLGQAFMAFYVHLFLVSCFFG